MQQAIDTFNSRNGEVTIFLDFIGKFQRSKQFEVNGADLLPILKACALLMLYNLIESSVRSAFSEVYLSVQEESLSFNTINSGLQTIWLSQQMDSVKPESANRDTYLTTVGLIARSIAATENVEIQSRKLPIAGNIDAEQIRKLCAKHGVTLKESRYARGGHELKVIKDQRNSLLHGHKSFIECGRDYEINDLKRMSKQTEHFLNSFLKSLKHYQETKLYRIPA